MQRKINLTYWFVYEWGKLPKQTPPGDFKVTTLENPLLSQQTVTSKEIPIPYINLQLNSYPNTSLDLFYSDNLSFQCTAPSIWLTNQWMDPSMWLTTNLRRMLVAKLFSSLTRWRPRNSLVAKPYGVQMQQFLEEKDEVGHMSSVTIYLCKTFASSCTHLHSLWRPLKYLIYV